MKTFYKSIRLKESKQLTFAEIVSGAIEHLLSHGYNPKDEDFRDNVVSELENNWTNQIAFPEDMKKYNELVSEIFCEVSRQLNRKYNMLESKAGKISAADLDEKEFDILLDLFYTTTFEFTWDDWKNNRAKIRAEVIKRSQEEFSDVEDVGDAYDEWAKINDKFVVERDFKGETVTEGIYGYYTYIQTQPGMKQPDKTLTYGGNLVFYRSPYSREKIGKDWKRHIGKIIEWSKTNNPSLARMTFDFRLQFKDKMESEEAYIAAIQDRIDKGWIELVESLQTVKESVNDDDWTYGLGEHVVTKLIDLFYEGISSMSWDVWCDSSTNDKERLAYEAIKEFNGKIDEKAALNIFWDWAEGLEEDAFYNYD